eukprot:10605-Alexandrium_andersonii.AAC.1
MMVRDLVDYVVARASTAVRVNLVLRVQNFQHVAPVIADRLLDLRSVAPLLQEAFPLFGQRWGAV